MKNVKIDLSNLPKNKNKILWKESVGLTVSFVYNDIKGEILITDVDGEYLIVKYKNYPPKRIFQSNLKRGRIYNIIHNIDNSYNFHYNKNDTINDKNRNLTVIETKNNGGKEICVKCNKCNYEFWEKESYFLSGKGCKCCSGRIVVKGINDLATTNPELIKYLKEPDEAFNITKGMNKKIKLKCPNCGFEKEISVNSFTSKPFRCNNCSDGFSFPNKLMSNILSTLNEFYISEYKPSWSHNRYYDFYLPNRNLIIEMDGLLGHGNTVHSHSNITIEETSKIDNLKNLYANNNGIDVIRIDCKISTYEYIKNQLLNEHKLDFLNINSITDNEWITILKNSYNSIIKTICDYFNENKCSPYIIAKNFGINVSTVRKYLKIGNSLNWCYYVPITGKHFVYNENK